MMHLPKGVRERLAAQQVPGVSPHPDADMLTAFAEDGLLPGEREQVIAHLAICAECREVTSLSQPEYTAEGTDATVIADPPKRALFGWNVMRWAGAAAAIVIVSAAALLFRSNQQRREAMQVVVESAAKQQADVPAAAPEQDKTEALAKKSGSEQAAQPGSIAGPERRVLTAPTAKERKQSAREERQADHFYQEPPTTNQQLTRGFAISSQQAGAVSGSLPVYPDSAGESPARQSANSRMPYKIAGGTQNTFSQNAQNAPAVAPPAPPPPKEKVAGARQKESDYGFADNSNLADKRADQASRDAAVGRPVSTNETVEVTSEAAAMDQVQQNTASPSAPMPSTMMATKPDLQSAAQLKNAWRITHTGTLERYAVDGAWERVTPAANVTFRSLAMAGSKIWAGGNNGALFHSSDAGTTWVRVTPSSGKMSLTGDIVRITVRGAQEIDLTTSTLQSWTTQDGGKTWSLR